VKEATGGKAGFHFVAVPISFVRTQTKKSMLGGRSQKVDISEDTFEGMNLFAYTTGMHGRW